MTRTRYDHRRNPIAAFAAPAWAGSGYMHDVRPAVYTGGSTPMIRTILAFVRMTLLATLANPAHAQQDKPNIPVIWGDDISLQDVRPTATAS